ncbi:MAG: type II toxin-antitoxin system HicB family antitoxin [Betaproteobacteria bacterium]|jgi:predicted HicB family RNase H-like nuclease|nr:type II toxin-antitoxin system HicB family antitoxin [Betaproteobacteria bacterium]NBO89632.1 type II toxin-antitoxin system HicB family antitoxin [Betaproteobacteria bacterium]
MTVLDYKGYQGSVEADLDSGTLFGKVLFVNDLVTYEGTTLPELQLQFRTSVDDYLQTCHSLGREPQQTCNGVFNVRVSPGLHRSALIRAQRDGVKLNAVVVSALQQYLNNTAIQHTHNHAVTIRVISFNEVKRIEPRAYQQNDLESFEMQTYATH